MLYFTPSNHISTILFHDNTRENSSDSNGTFSIKKVSSIYLNNIFFTNSKYSVEYLRMTLNLEKITKYITNEKGSHLQIT